MTDLTEILGDRGSGSLVSFVYTIGIILINVN